MATKTEPLGGTGHWDYLIVDPALLLADHGAAVYKIESPESRVGLGTEQARTFLCLGRANKNSHEQDSSASNFFKTIRAVPSSHQSVLGCAILYFTN